MFKKDNREIVIISLGGSIICPDKPDVPFIKELKKMLSKHLDERRFVLIVGGGKIARDYIDAGSEVSNITDVQKDWIGIYATRLNAALVKNTFGDNVHPNLIIDPSKNIKFKEDFLIGAGYLPGWSTDYDAVLIAKRFGVKTVINLSNIDFVYDKDPKKHKDAKPVSDMSWDQIISLVGHKFSPGLNMPFDPIAAKEAKKLGLKILVANGRKLKNLDKLLYGEIFDGTIIQ